MDAIDMSGIHPVQLMHPLRQIGIRRLYQQIVLVGHQAIGMTNPPEMFVGHGQDIDKRRAVVVNTTEEDAAPLVTLYPDV
jgi:hypothetical protein